MWNESFLKQLQFDGDKNKKSIKVDGVNNKNGMKKNRKKK